EAAAEHCQGKAVVQGCPLRVQWGKPKPLDNMDREERMKHAREGRALRGAPSSRGAKAITAGAGGGAEDNATEQDAAESNFTMAPPPGKEEAQYASLAGD